LLWETGDIGEYACRKNGEIRRIGE